MKITDVKAYDMVNYGCFEKDFSDEYYKPDDCSTTWGGVLSIKEAAILTISNSEITMTDAAIS